MKESPIKTERKTLHLPEDTVRALNKLAAKNGTDFSKEVRRAIDEYLDLDLRQFVAAFNLFLRKKKKVEEIRKHHIRSEKQRVTAEARMADIRDFFREDPFREADFRELIEKRDDRYDIALTFSSVLEMMKEKKLDAEQNYIYGEIKVRATEHLMEGEADDE